MKKRILCAAVCAAVWGAGLMLPVSITENSLVIPAKAAADAADNAGDSGLITENGHFRYYEDGQPVTERWITTDGHTYYFDEDGNAAVLKCKIDGDYYVFDKNGRLLLPSACGNAGRGGADLLYRYKRKSRQRLVCRQTILF